MRRVVQYAAISDATLMVLKFVNDFTLIVRYMRIRYTGNFMRHISATPFGMTEKNNQFIFPIST